MSVVPRILVFLYPLSVRAVACPLCDTTAAKELREALAEANTVWNITAMLLPFAVLMTGLRFYCVGFRAFFKVNANSGNGKNSR